MRKTNVAKILGIIGLLLVISLIGANKVFASEATVTASSCNVGESFTVTVNIPEDVSAYEIGGVTVTFSDGSTQSASRKVGVNLDLTWPGNYTASFSGKVAGTATISVNGVILTNSSHAVVNTISTLETSTNIVDPTPAPAPADNTPAVTTPPVTLNFRDVNETMYTTRRVNVRQSYGTDSNIIQTLAVGTQVTRTGIGDGTKDGYAWSRISYNGITGYLITGALTDEAVVVPEEPTEEQPPEEVIQEPEENGQEVTELSEEDEALVSSLSEKFGAIPEVGLNIMPFMFLGSCVACVALMMETKKRMA